MRKNACLFTLSVLVLVGTFPLFAGGNKNQASKITVALAYSAAEPVHQAMIQVAREYESKNPGLSFDVLTYADFEVTMKTKMAANDLPDLWQTHGWSVVRYSEYLEPLNNQSWASRVNPKILPTISNSKGQFFVLPFNVETQGIVINRDVLDAVGVDPFSIKTWDDFRAACEKVKAAGKIPLDIAGGAAEDWTIGTIYNTLGQSFMITNERKNYRSSLADGSFNWDNWRPVQDLLLEFRDKGYYNPDYTQGTFDNQVKRLGGGQAAFIMSANNIITQAKMVNPNARLGFIPVPAASPDDSPTVTSGERFTLGVWKNSPRKADALKFLEYCTAPEIINRVASLDSCEEGLIGPGYKSDIKDLQEYLDKLGGIRGYPYFDRAYMPSGMWDAFCKTAIGLLANTLTRDQALTQLKNDYRTLWDQQH